MISGTDKIFSAIQGAISPLKTALQGTKPASKSPDLTALQGDQLTLSPSGLKALEFLNSQDRLDQADDLSEDKLETLQQRGAMLATALQMKLKSFEGKLMQQMQTAGIDTSKEMNLEDAGAMGILETGGHPDADKISKLFESNPGLTKDFREVAKLADLVRSLQQLPDDAAAGSMNLAGIAARYAKESQQNQDIDQNQNAQFIMKVMSSGASFTFE